MKTCQDDVTEKMREICNGQSECNPNAMKDQILDPNGCAKWNNLLLSRRYYFEVDFECKETIKLCSGCENRIMEKPVTCPNGRKVNVKSGKELMIRNGQELEESNSVCTTDIANVLRYHTNGRNEAIFYYHMFSYGQFDSSLVDYSYNCGVIHGFEITFGCAATKNGNPTEDSIKTVSWTTVNTNNSPATCSDGKYTIILASKLRAFSTLGNYWQRTFSSIHKKVCEVDGLAITRQDFQNFLSRDTFLNAHYLASNACRYNSPILIDYTSHMIQMVK
uniref:Uncharacterized protein n=2 Tax=Clytia hemisphaerica TaxID=252671 RepID=A0A7M5UPM1_9CNID